MDGLKPAHRDQAFDDLHKSLSFLDYIILFN